MNYSLDDTIAAIATPHGRGGIGIVRLSGTEAIEIADKIFAPTLRGSLAGLPTHTVHHGWIQKHSKTIDEVMVTLLRSPRTYTGEDTIEISAHGGSVVLGKILKLCLEHGARLAAKGEFTFRAFTHGKMDLAKAESVAELISSKTEEAAQASVDQLKGALSRKIAAWQKSLIDLLARVEAALDHAEEDIRFISRAELKNNLLSLREDVNELLKTADKGKLLRDGLRVSIVGKPNVGKSSLLNALLERERAIVTEIPGTTRDVLEEALEVAGVPLVVSDTAGIRSHANDIVEQIGQEKTKAAILSSDLILWILDGSVPVSDEDRHIAHVLSAGFLTKTIPVINKIDLSSRISEKDVRAMIDSAHPSVRISATRRTHLRDLEKAIISFVDMPMPATETPILMCTRHHDVLLRVSGAIQEAQKASDDNESEEFIALHLRTALSTLGEITGETATEEILENIFSRFCVGK